MSGVRVASWIFVACALTCAIGIFVPAIELRIGGHVLSKRTSLSLRQAAGDRDLVRKLLAASRGAQHTHAGNLVHKVAPHASGTLKDVLGDANDAMDTLSGISDDDAKTAGLVITIVVWAFFVACLAMALLVFLDVVGGEYHRWRLVTALAIATVVAAIGIAIRYACTEVAFEANDELGRDAVGLGAATLVIPITAIGAFCAAITLLVLHVRAARK